MLTKFILILTITSSGYAEGSSSMVRVEMTTLKKCTKAGDFWLKNLNKHKTSIRHNYSAICVEK